MKTIVLDEHVEIGGTGAITIRLADARVVELRLPRKLMSADLGVLAATLNSLFHAHRAIAKRLPGLVSFPLSEDRCAELHAPSPLTDSDLDLVEAQIVEGFEFLEALFDAVEHTEKHGCAPSERKPSS